MNNDEKPYDPAENVYCYFGGLLVLEFLDEDDHLIAHHIAKGNDNLEFIKNGLSNSIWQVRCKTDNASKAIESIKDFVGECLQLSNINSLNLCCQLSLEWLNYVDMDNDVDSFVDSYIIGHGAYTIDNLLRNTQPLFLQWQNSNWR